MNNLFNQKLLIQKAQEEINLSDYFEKRKILNNWINSLEKGILSKSKEEEFQGEFLNDIFSLILGAVNKSSGNDEWNLQRESKTRIDGVIGFFDVNGKDDVRAVIELKGPTISLDQRQKRSGDTRTPVEQAFNYAPKYGKNCQWVIVSNYKEIRLYRSNDMTEYEVFFLENLKDDLEFQKFIYILSFEALVGTANKKAKALELSEEYQKNQIEIEKKFYNEYKNIRLHIFENMKENNPETDENTLLEKVQKLLDRFLFICFCEDKGLLEKDFFNTILKKGKDFGSIFDIFKVFCNWINLGNPKENISHFNGGLFKNDDVLNSLNIDDKVFEELKKISDYDFDSDLNVNILGHIFEQSISDIEELKKSISGEEFDQKKSKRKKDGIFYTPQYITKYIVENSIKNWLDDKRKELGEDDLPKLNEKDYIFDIAKKNYTKNYRKHIEFWQQYREAVRNIKIIDPACGSGAFLITAFEFLLNYNKYLDDKIFDLVGTSDLFSDRTKKILQNNIFGVDLNKESVEITKLSLWLKTADKNKTLASLENNIKCGNSLIDDPEIAGNLAFNWEKEFPEIFANGGFDIVVGNPPYVKEDIGKNAFNGLHQHLCYQGKMDLWYFFGWLALTISKKESAYISFIASNNWITNDGASKFRNKINDCATIFEYIDFNNFMIFEEAQIQTMIYIMKNDNKLEKYKFKYSKILNNKIAKEEIMHFLQKLENNNFEYFDVDINRVDYKDKLFNFNSEKNRNVLNKIKANANFYLKKEEIFSGIDIGQDFINAKSLEILGDDFKIGDGIFNLSEEEYNSYNFFNNEKEIIKPFYTTKEVNRYYFNEKNKYWVIYTTSKFKNPQEIIDYPNIKKHLDKFSKVITSDNKPYGLHRARNEEIFKGEKILSIRKHERPAFSYVTLDTYVNRTFNIIKTDRVNLKYLLVLLNSKLTKFWLKEKGKMQGDIFQVDITPIISIPLIIVSKDQEAFISLSEKMLSLNRELQDLSQKFQRMLLRKFDLEKLSTKLQEWYLLDFSDFIKELKRLKVKLSLSQESEWEEYFLEEKSKAIAIDSEIKNTDKEIDSMVYRLYDLTDEEIKIIEEE
ncbi:Eco57I restriction-modification methylase domain-containing protein [Fusobacterium pseudoperiodonticum]|uniref:site-specific DNA-methyltransferase (adenine-specific) n=1 Tax=Fusobacterium pseudoperiodonticum TaxID=2663009 RepID=A0AAD0APP9_9FUSO|nr:DNA methyltransferase [Fusobacterium pseudoperiodonticum]ATV36776.1 restriction endonuclease subunit M [Fusobacterium pseudoperiodonticum]ATV62695.1 restriction endonuclease subunit M [Fusobacterium pseudoperiodonticum]